MYARFWKRALAAMLDLLVVASIHQVSVILSIFIMYSFSTINNYERFDELLWIFDIVRSVLVLVVLWCYFAIMESSKFQATFGKLAMGLKVVDQEGKRITFRRATARFWSKSLSAITVLIGWFIAGFTKKKQALHDLIADTCLVEEEVLDTRQVETVASV
ncbi:RDD family protein [Paenibacillus bouchesdurhonensis]|uniref:RDD family protein n=1 Tax=Paenibacillus bouchesdurhonensis TaxID=1870990 RepID=UPI000DA603AB|nr:RDD family protein [Paenibacillus bouchesdurhonensis]